MSLPVHLNLGCGKTKSISERHQWINIDKDPAVQPDHVVDLEKDKLPLDDNSIDKIYCSNLMEHIQNFIPLMEDCYRVLKPKGIFYIKVPAVNDRGHAFQDPTHVRFFVKKSFYYFDRSHRLGQVYNWNLDFRINKLITIDAGPDKMEDIRATLEAVKPPRPLNKDHR